MTGWGGRRAGAGRKRKSVGPSDEKWSPFVIDFANRIASEAPGHEGLLRRVVLALTCRQAPLTEIAAVLGLSPAQVEMQFGEQLRNGKTVARFNAVNLINAKARRGNVTAILWLLRSTKRALKEDQSWST